MRRIMILCVMLLAACARGGPPPGFYDPVGPIEGPRGSLIRVEPLGGAPDGAQAYRIIYRSSDPEGRPLPVSGMVVVPRQPAPAAGRPVVAWAHPTTGVVPECGPSLSPFRYLMIAGLSDMLKAGFVVTATDYPGLGTGTVHPFLDGPSEGRALLDSVRAAALVPGSAANGKFVLWGHSQGGQAVLFAAAMAEQYAPELRLQGVAAAAPATDLATLFRDDLGTTGGNNLTALTLWSWARVYGASYSGVVVPAAMPAVDTIARRCIDTIFEGGAKRRADKALDQAFFTVPDITIVEPWRSIIARNTPETPPRSVALFLAQGTADSTVRPAVTYDFARRACAAGDAVTLDVMSKGTHGWIAMDSARTAVAWMRGRLSDAPPDDECRQLDSIIANASVR